MDYSILIGCGNKDSPMAIEAAKMWQESEPESQLVIFENVGHIVNMDVPDKFNEDII